MSDTYFTADTHFCHARVIGLCQRPFADVIEMREELVRRWNEVVQPKDAIWHLGDFAWRDKPGEAEAIFHRLNGTKHLIVGNHDGPHLTSLPWASVAQMALIEVERQRLHLCHYPLLEWQGFHRGTWHLFGHVHGNNIGIGASLDVGVDVNDCRPMSMEEIRRRLRDRERI